MGQFLFEPLRRAADASTAQVHQASEAVYAKFRSFRASNASCFDPKDKARLLGIVEVSFGSLSAFDVSIRKAFASNEMQRISHAGAVHV